MIIYRVKKSNIYVDRNPAASHLKSILFQLRFQAIYAEASTAMETSQSIDKVTLDLLLRWLWSIHAYVRLAYFLAFKGSG